jgi:magnesium and cobalt transporter
MSDDAGDDRSQSVGWLERLGRVLGGEPKSREGLVELLSEAAKQGLIEADTLAMLQGALGVDELQVRDVMIPRSHMVVLPKTGTLDDILPLILDSGHSRFPVVGEDRDEVEGILLAKDLLQLVSGGQALDLNALLRPAVIIPESKRLNVLLREFRVSKNHMAIVVDEYGGTSGLITIEDVLEEIVGDIDDEHDVDAVEDVQKLDDGGFLVQALATIEDINDRLGTAFSDADYDTIGGLVVAQFGRVPEVDETTQFGGWAFVVKSADERRLHAMEMRPVD